MLQIKLQNRALELYLGEEFLITVDPIFQKSELASWDIASKEQFFALFYPLEGRIALRVSLYALSRRALHSGQLERLLGDRLFSQGAIESAVGEVKRLGYLQDAEFEQNFTQRLQKQGKSRHEIVHKARQKGIPLQNLSFAPEEESLKILIEKRYPVLLERGGAQALKQKAVQALVRKGFPLPCILKYFIV